MNFLSLSFAVFFGAVLLLLKAFRGKKAQQRILLGASYLFYALWDWRFLLLLIALSAAVWFLGKAAYEKESKPALMAGLILCIGVLGIFKYLGFFVESFCSLFGLSRVTLRLILPVGLSFYIFQAISYLCDAYRKKITPASLPHVLLYIGFFPQIVSGPIVKAHDFLPQLEQSHPITEENVSAGLQQFCVGMFKKVVIADRLGVGVNAVFAAPAAYSGLSLAVAAFAYTIQLYCDFSGYSDMAVGAARCMGYDLGKNFNMPFLARNPSDFWRRWHISLSSWFRDYVYIPLGGSRKGDGRTCWNLFITMLLSGIWHGANWTFLVWGILHGAVSAAHKIFRDWQKKRGSASSGALGGIACTVGTFLLVALLFIPFRAESLGQAWLVLVRIFTMAEGIHYVSVFALLYGGLILGMHALAGIRNGGNTPWKPLNLEKFSSKLILCAFLLLCFLFAYIGDSAFLYAQF